MKNLSPTARVNEHMKTEMLNDHITPSYFSYIVGLSSEGHIFVIKEFHVTGNMIICLVVGESLSCQNFYLAWVQGFYWM